MRTVYPVGTTLYQPCRSAPVAAPSWRVSCHRADILGRFGNRCHGNGMHVVPRPDAPRGRMPRLRFPRVAIKVLRVV